MRAMQLARDLGASRILMLGYDTDLANGTHWHGQHQAGKDAKGKRIFIGNPDSDICRNWHRLFRQLAAELKGIEIVNCSRATALTCFTRQSLDPALACNLSTCRACMGSANTCISAQSDRKSTRLNSHH